MKKILLIISALLISTHLFAQKVEFSVGASPELFNFTGKSATASSSIVQGYDDNYNYTKNPYNSKASFSYSFSGQVQVVAKSGFIVGLQAAFEILKSKTSIDTVYPQIFYLTTLYNSTPQYNTPAKGQSILSEDFINLNPYIGYRFGSGGYKFDILPGMDIGFDVHSNVKGSATATSDAIFYPVNYNPEEIKRDVRLRLGFAAAFKHYALTASYSHGLSNYYTNTDGEKAYSRVFRLGLAYKF